MSQLSDGVLLAKEAHAAASAAKADLALAPARHSPIVICTDARLDPAKRAGLADVGLVGRVSVQASLPHTFVGLFMGLYTPFAVMAVAEMLGATYGLGWYIQCQTSYSAYANVDTALIIMALLCSGIVRALFAGRDHLLQWQKGIL